MLQSSLDHVPIDVREERFDVLGTIRRFVIQNKRMLPNVHYQHGSEAGDVSGFMQSDPMIRQRAVHGILVTDGPANSTHLADADELGLPNVIAAETLFR